MNNTTLYHEDHQATYCPEDDKLRLYVGRVPRAEYEALRAEGWTSTPKQDCDFVAVWTPDREDTALSYAGVILDEDASPAERAADRAERFGGYRDGNLAKAETSADRYDATPSAHGRQSFAAACRAADRHDRHAGRAVNAWDKAEYWTHRTAGVIGHALHLSSPGVRMGRIKTLEAELRKAEERNAEYARQYRLVDRIAADPAAFVDEVAARRHGGDLTEGTRSAVYLITGSGKIRHPLSPDAPLAYDWEHARSENPPTVADYAAQYLRTHHHPESEGFGETSIARHINHLKLRLAYEWQMLNAQGGRESVTDMEKGGTFKGGVIAKVNKSTATGRVVSVAVIVPKVDGWVYRIANEPGTPYALMTMETERAAPGSYQPPTPESLAKLAEFETARKQALAAHKAKVPPCPLVNPTDADAERLQDLLNAENLKCPWRQRNMSDPASTVLRLTQAEYTRLSGGTYTPAETTEICPLGQIPERSNLYSASKAERNRRIGAPVCKVRTAHGKGYTARRVVILTDKPQKPLPRAVWDAPASLPAATPETAETTA